MGQCIYCGESVGWFRTRHKKCQETVVNLTQNLLNTVQANKPISADTTKKQLIADYPNVEYAICHDLEA